jgi:hypothetical protein
VSFEVVHGTWANSVNKNTVTSVLGHCVDFTNIQNTFGKKTKKQMRLGFHNYALIMQTEKSCIKFGNNKLNCLQRYDIAQRFSICANLKIFCTITGFRSFVKEDNDLNKT